MQNSIFALLWLLMSLFMGNDFVPKAMADHAATYGATYGKKFTYQKGMEVRFPDFGLEFLGTAPGALYPGSDARRMGDFHEFRVSTPNQSQVVRWSSGTGDIGPAVFEVGGKCFWLELVDSMIFGRLNEMEAVVSLDPESPSTCERRG